jgi:curved DNA-binding protein CbpA
MYFHSSDFELVRLYHPDVCKAHGLDPSLAESRFQAVTGAYNALRSGIGGSSFSPSARDVGGEAEEIRNRLATWRSREQSRGSLVWMRRQRALRAEADAGKWWKSDRVLLYSLASVVSDIPQLERIQLRTISLQTLVAGAMHFTVRSPAQRNEQAKRYIELKTRQAQERKLLRENIPQAQEDPS